MSGYIEKLHTWIYQIIQLIYELHYKVNFAKRTMQEAEGSNIQIYKKKMD